MKRALVFCVALTAAACDFEGAYRARCDAGKFTVACPEFSDAGGVTGGGTTGGGTTGGGTTGGGTTGGGTTGGGAPSGGGDGMPMGGGPANPYGRHYFCGPNPSGGALGCFGLNDWCGEHPSGGPATELRAVWGDENTLWFAGAGPTLGRVPTGNSPINESNLLPNLSFAPWTDPPAITGVAGVDAGVWLIGKRMPALFGQCLGASFEVADAGELAAITTWGGLAYGVRLADDRFLTLHSSVGRTVSALSDLDDVYRLYVDERFCLVSGTGTSGQPLLIDCNGNRSIPLPAGTTFVGPIEKLFDGGVVIGANQKLLLPPTSLDAGATDLLVPGFTEDVAQIAPVLEHPTLENETILLGEEGGRFNLATGMQRVGGTGFRRPRGTWVTPPGEVLSAAEHGTIESLVSNGSPAGRVPYQPASITGVSLSVEDQLAVGWGVIFRRRNDFAWDEVPLAQNLQRNWAAVARDASGTIWLIDDSGAVYTMTGNVPTNVYTLDAGIARGAPRTATAIQLRSGEVALGVGRSVMIPDAGTLIEHNLGTFGINHLSGLAEATNGDIYAVGYGAPPSTSGAQGRAVRLRNGVWTTVAQHMHEIFDVSECPDSTVIVAGSHAFLHRIIADGGVMPINVGGVPNGIDFMSAMCDSSSSVYTLDNQGGVVIAPDAGTARFEIPGWGRVDANTNLRPTFIRSFRNDAGMDFLLITGASGSLKTRSYP